MSERLGIGGGFGRGGVSHSVTSGIRSIQQEGVQKLAVKKSSDSFQSDEWEVVSNEERSNGLEDLRDIQKTKPKEDFLDAWERSTTAET